VKNIIMLHSTFAEMLAALSGAPGAPRSRAVRQKAIEAVARAFSWFFPCLRERKCLFRSLLILKWSTGRGLSPLLNIGLKFSGRVQGHAWLTVNDQPFCDSSRLPGLYPRQLAAKGRLRYWCEA
jgi:hypothetical protein